jgi:hypothetical protein
MVQKKSRDTATFSAPVQTDTGAHTASWVPFYPVGKCDRCVTLTPSISEVWKQSSAIPLLSLRAFVALKRVKPNSTKSLNRILSGRPKNCRWLSWTDGDVAYLHSAHYYTVWGWIKFGLWYGQSVYLKQGKIGIFGECDWFGSEY